MSGPRVADLCLMRLFIDCRYVRTTVHDGISRYTASLTRAAAELAEVTMLIHDPEQLRMLPDCEAVQISSPTGPREPFVAAQINRFSPDVVFSPMQTMGSMGRKYRLILTLHDLIYYTHRTPPRDLPPLVRAGWRAYHLSYAPQRWALNRADAVATVSDTTRELMAAHRLTSRPVHLIPNAPQPVGDPREPGVHPSKELVYLGSFMEYKNVEALVQGMALLPGYTLHLCSPITESRRKELHAIAENPDQLVFHHGISELDLTELIRRCTALVTLSRSEGYGLPLIEAMSHGTPVVATDLQIFREVVGEAVDERGAQLVSPDSAEGLAAAVRNLEAPDTFAAASSSARRRSQAYSWEDSAQRLVRLAESWG